MLKGRSNYACLHRIREGVPDDQGILVDVPEGSMGKQGARAAGLGRAGGEARRQRRPRQRARATPTASWRQVVGQRTASASAQGACPFGEECFAERAKEQAPPQPQLVVTNHSLLAIDAIEGVPMIPEYDVVVIDEAHELVARVTQAATDELSASDVERAARRAQRHVEDDEADDLADAGDALARRDRRRPPPAGSTGCPTTLADALVLVRDAARACLSARCPSESESGEADAGAQQARARSQEIFNDAERMAARRSSPTCCWLTDARSGRAAAAAPRRAAPGVGAAARQAAHRQDRGVHQRDAEARRRLRRGRHLARAEADRGVATEPVDGSRTDRAFLRAGEDAVPWRGLDVGSPFDYGKQAILYVARHLPPPGRDGLGKAQLDEIVELVDAAEGRTLGLFSSRRAAETAAEEVRERLPHLTTLAQGEAQLPELAKQFVERPAHLPVRHAQAVAGRSTCRARPASW